MAKEQNTKSGTSMNVEVFTADNTTIEKGQPKKKTLYWVSFGNDKGMQTIQIGQANYEAIKKLL